MKKKIPTASADFKARVKRNVADNFDRSYHKYQAFEDRHRFFYSLALKLADCIRLQPESSVLDVGCGSGISAQALHERHACRVLGVDLSAKMVSQGLSRIRNPSIRLVVGDGERLIDQAAGRRFDYVLYNAAIFIMPDVDRTLQEAHACLRPGGKIAYSFYPELAGSADEDLLAVAFDRAGEPRPRFKVVTDYERAGQALETVCGNITHHRWERPLDLGFLKDFFSIPAQSASLFPGLAYEERLDKVDALLGTLAGEVAAGKIVWRMAEGTK
jgi:SAM-dependent methyltransferase